ncbi:chitooligosaccharidolytic beta-N-acetylglucosaminidase [Frankliniella occidentalis]|uniref:beta-N-acetylhexosaminidase n=1 Tax=Frankliniella occidentalis TaxID=133901 RepID=A0A9C6X0W3_FRAOC|nr:chitooligosaccharidolytic beta-N-acetylglucosaminidase [Frankliniella occidentalis]
MLVQALLPLGVLVVLAPPAAPAIGGGSGPWECVEGRCVGGAEVAASQLLQPVPLHQASQAACRLHCGQHGALWPRPTGPTTIGRQVVSIDPGRVRIQLSVPPPARARASGPGPPLGVAARAVLQEASRGLDAALRRLCDAGCVAGDHGLAVVINATGADLGLDWDTDESYRLDVSSKGGTVRATVHAATVWGARHGVQTLGQLVTAIAMPATSAGSPPRVMLVAVAAARVADAPRYPHRGVLLDTARHYLPLSALLRTVDAMAASKLNVLHWHATDSHSFPLLLPGAPQLARTGAYSPREVYSPAAVASVLR